MQNKGYNHRTVIITGANSGIGKAAAHRFADEGYTVIMACRSRNRSLPVLDSVKAKSKNDRVYLMELDTSSFKSIRSFASEYTDTIGTLDVLIHNAAYFEHGSGYKLSTDGIELTFATNVAGPWLLTMELRELLKKSPDARVLHAGSNIIKHFFNPKVEIDLDRVLPSTANIPEFRVYDAYRDSKMALLMLTIHMADEFKEDDISINMLQINGATISKETLRKFSPRYRFAARIQNLFFKPPEFMAGLYYNICTAENFKGVTGKLINHKLEVMIPEPENPGALEQLRQLTGAGHYPRYAQNKEMTDKLIELCAHLTSEEPQTKL
jgi:NAD(P)-dependent dehydrogenase (short-subunit alcohol dehydrogenase family)